MGAKGEPKTGGRKPGSVSKRLSRLPDAQAIAERLGVNPLEVLLHFTANNWQALGYDSPEKKVATSSGPVYVDRISTDERIAAAKSAADYLYARRKSVEIKDPDGNLKSFADLMKELVSQSVKS